MTKLIKKITRIGIIVALMCAIAPLSIPLQPVPITMATFVLWTVALILPTKEAVIATSLFVLLGAIGLPVFGGFRGGPAIVFGITGGYIWAFPFTPIFFAMGSRLFKNLFFRAMFGAFVSFTFIALVGVTWMFFWTIAKNPGTVPNLVGMIKAGYLIFLPTTAIKGVMAWLVADRLKNRI